MRQTEAGRLRTAEACVVSEWCRRDFRVAIPPHPPTSMDFCTFTAAMDSSPNSSMLPPTTARLLALLALRRRAAPDALAAAFAACARLT